MLTATTAVVITSAVIVLFLALRFILTDATDSEAENSTSIPLVVQSQPVTGITQILVASPDTSLQGSLARRFRLAGTILGVSNSGADEPMAVLDDRVTVSQSIVRRNMEIIPGVVLIQVKTSSVVLRGPVGEEEIFLEKTMPAMPSSSLETNATDIGDSRADLAKRFGGQEVFPGRWNFSREALLNYYSELRDQPERLLSIFDSMDPVYTTDLDGENRITGYVVGVEGEADFFSAAGLENGDIVRSVNSVDMTNRRRAEAFIKNFVEGNASTFVLDVERNGKKTKQVYVVE